MKLCSQLLMLRFRCTALTLGLMLASLSEASPEQYLSQLYTEILGRLPTPAEWATHEPNFTQQTLSVPNVQSLVNSMFNSSEFQQIGYNETERAYILYRALMLREPNTDEMSFQANRMRQGISISTVVNGLLASEEYTNLFNGRLRSHKKNGFVPSSPFERPDIRGDGGEGNMTGTELQALLDAASPGDTVFLAQGALIRVDEQLVIPYGVTLATYAPDPVDNIFRLKRAYARMARIVRTRLFNQPLISVNPGGRILGVWVDGRRSELRYNDPVLKILGLSTTERFTFSHNVSLRGGLNLGQEAEISYSKLSDSCGWTTVHSIGNQGDRVVGFTRVTQNVVSSYEADRDLNGAFFTDGISSSTSDAIIDNNEVVDSSDVGIVIFNSGLAVPQNSQVTNNIVFFAGVNGWGGIVLDHSIGMFELCEGIAPNGPYNCHDTTIAAITSDYSVNLVQNNVIFSSNSNHTNIGISMGVHPWGLPLFGQGAQVINNTVGTPEQPLHTASGLVISGIKDPIVLNNTFHLNLDQSLVSFYSFPLILDPSRTTLSGNSAIQPGFITHELWATLRPKSNGFVFGNFNLFAANNRSQKLVIDDTIAKLSNTVEAQSDGNADWIIIPSHRDFGDGERHYTITNRRTHRVLEATDGGIATNVYTSQLNQYWKLEPGNSGHVSGGVRFYNSATGDYLSRDPSTQVTLSANAQDIENGWVLNKVEHRAVNTQGPLLTFMDPYGEIYQMGIAFSQLSENRSLGNFKAMIGLDLFSDDQSPGRPMGFTDYDADGDQDMAVLQSDGALVILINDGNGFNNAVNLGSMRNIWQWDITNQSDSWEKPVGFINLGDTDGEDLVVVDRNGNLEAGLINTNGLAGNPEFGNAASLNLAGMNSNLDSPIKGIGSGDFDGDGDRELLFVDLAGNLLRVDASGSELLPAVNVGNPVSQLGWGLTSLHNGDYKPIGIADVDGNSTEDILLVNGEGVIVAYIMVDGEFLEVRNIGNARFTWDWNLRSNSFWTRPLSVPYGKGWWNW